MAIRFPWQPKRDLEFIDSYRSIYQQIPIMRAKDIKTTGHEVQKKKYGSYKFPLCPGMDDYSKLGYIIPAWTDMHIMANKAGCATRVGSPIRGSNGFKNAVQMGKDVPDGFIQPEDDVPFAALKFDSPWKIFASGDISALVMPAIYHSNFLDDLYVWPGIVDYKKFHVVNFICTPKRKCEVEIKAGDPLLHVIPFWNKPILAGFGPGTDIQIDATRNEIPKHTKQYYRKNQMTTKTFGIEKSSGE